MRWLEGLLFVVLLSPLSGCRVEIVHDLDESQANQILDVLGRASVGARKARVSRGTTATYTVSVARSDAPRSWRLLRERNLPRPKTKGVDELLGKVGLVPTATQERALLHRALAGELARTLQRVEGVRDARVHVVLPQRQIFAASDAKPRKPRASVLLKVGATSPLSVAQVKRLVAGAVDGLVVDGVEVVIIKPRSRLTPAGVQARAPLVAVGPFDVAPGSRGPLLATLITLVVIAGALVIFLLLALRRGRRTREAAEALAAQNPAAVDGRGTSGAGYSVDLDSSLSLVARAVGRPTVGATRSRHES